MTDITSTHLEAALLDQNVAGVFHGKRYAFIAVSTEAGPRLGVAVADEPGYNEIARPFESKAEADEWARSLNEHIGLTPVAQAEIICSTMRRHVRRGT